MLTRNLRRSLFLTLLSTFALSLALVACGDLDGEDSECDPAFDGDDCVCFLSETEEEIGDDCTEGETADGEACFCQFFGDDANNGAQDNAEVSIKNFSFNPASVTIKTGGTVTWTNDEATQHTVTIDSEGFDEVLDQGQSASHTFNTAGTFTVIDRLDGSGTLMMTVTVQ